MTQQNTGHGHVSPRPDGARAKCGGPIMCSVCQEEQRQKDRTLPRDPTIVIPEGFSGTEAEAVALAVAGAVAGLQRERDTALVLLRETVDLLPTSSWAGDQDVKDRAETFLEEMGGAPEPAP